jgi:hypothetical protein
MTADTRQWGILAAAVLACVWLAYSGPGYQDAPSFYSFLALLVLLLPLFLGVFEAAMPGPYARYAAVFAVAWFGLSPANALTLVDFTRRAVLWSALGLVAGLVLYQWRPGWRKFGIYLLPAAGAACCHRLTLAFAPILLAWVFFSEKNADWRAFPAALLRCIPGALVSLASLLLVKADPAIPGETLPADAASALRGFLAPVAATGPEAAQDWGIPLFIMLLGIIVAAALWRQTRLVSFGLWWFLVLLAAAPGEPLPACIGLALAASLVLAKAVEHLGGAGHWSVPIGCACLLIASGYGSVERTDALGAGVNHAQIFKSRTAERWLGLSLYRYQAGKYGDSIAAAKTALRLKPEDAEAWNNICAAYAGMKMWDQAIQAAQEALKLEPDSPGAKSNLAWAEQQRRLEPQ